MKKYISLILASILFTMMFTSCGGASKISISLTNALGYELIELYLTGSEKEDWGDNCVGNETLKDGSTITLEIEKDSSAGTFDIRAADTEGYLYHFYDMTLTNEGKIALSYEDDACVAVVTSQKGEQVKVIGSSELPIEKIPAPTAEDALTNTMALPEYESIVVPYPETMIQKEGSSAARQLQLEAINDEATNTLIINWYSVGDSFDDGLNSTPDNANNTFLSITEILCKRLTGDDKFISSIGSDFEDGGDYYGISYYVWMSGSAIDSSVTSPVRGVLECRYYGPVGSLLIAFSLADEENIRNYYDIGTNILNAMDVHSDWKTADGVAAAEAKVKAEAEAKAAADAKAEADAKAAADAKAKTEAGNNTANQGNGQGGYYEEDYYEDDYYYDYKEDFYDPDYYDPNDWGDPGDYYDDYYYDDYYYDDYYY